MVAAGCMKHPLMGIREACTVESKDEHGGYKGELRIALKECTEVEGHMQTAQVKYMFERQDG